MSARNSHDAVFETVRTLVLSGAIILAATGGVAAQETASGDAGSPAAATSTAPTAATTTGVTSSGAPAPAKTPTQDALDVERTYQIPDPPAMVLIGSTATLDRPGTPAEVGAALVNLVTPEGTVRSGAALEISLRALGLSQANSHYDYVHQPLSRFAQRAALSIATVADAATGTQPAVTRLAVGLRLVIFDEADPLLQTRYREQVEYAEAQCKAKEPDPVKRPACMVEVQNGMTQEQLDKLPKPRWNANALAVSTAVDWAFDQGGLKSHHKDVFAAWLAGAYGYSNWFQISAAAQYRRLWASDSNLAAFAARLRLGNDKIRFTGEGGYSFVSPDDPTLRKGRAAVGGEFLVGNGTWASVSIGGDFAGTDSPTSVFVLSNLKFAFLNKPTDW